VVEGGGSFAALQEQRLGSVGGQHSTSGVEFSVSLATMPEYLACIASTAPKKAHMPLRESGTRKDLAEGSVVASIDDSYGVDFFRCDYLLHEGSGLW